MGCLLMVVGVFAAPVLARVAAATGSGVARLSLAVVADMLRLGFFVGLIMLILGVLRNRRWRRGPESQA